MFGYIKIHKSELKVKEYEIYKGLYCSLCKRLGKDYGILGRMTLNYDFTFFLLCRMALKSDDVCFSSSHCSFNPRKKCCCCPVENEDLEYTAALSIMFSFFKVADDISDDNFLKKIPKLLLYPLFKHKYKKSKNKYPDLFSKLESELKKQNEIEKKEKVCVDECADISAKVLGIAFAEGIDDSIKNSAYSFGYSIGRLVYLFDAADDFENDKKYGRFNAFLKNLDKYGDNVNEKMRRMIDQTADENARIYETLPIKRFKGIIDNVIYYGFGDTINSIFEKKEVTK